MGLKKLLYSIIIINIKKNASVVRKRVSDFQKNFFDKKNKNYESASWLNIVKFLIREKNFSELEIALDSRTWKNMLKAKYLK